MGLWIVGAGGFGRETLDACLAAGVAVEGFLDDRTRGEVRGLPVQPVGDGRAREVVVAIADPTIRREIVGRLASASAWPGVQHPSVVISPETTIGEGSVVLAQSFLSSNVTCGNHVHVNYCVSVGHDTTVGAFSTLLPGARLAGNVTVGEGCLVGSNAAVLQGLRIGPGATIGAGAVVTKDVAAGATVVGVPARPMG